MDHWEVGHAQAADIRKLEEKIAKLEQKAEWWDALFGEGQPDIWIETGKYPYFEYRVHFDSSRYMHDPGQTCKYDTAQALAEAIIAERREEED